MANKFTTIIFILVLIPAWGFGQKKISFGANLNAELSEMAVTNARSPHSIHEKGGVGIGYTAGIQIQYKLANKAFLRSGLNYQNLTHRHKIEGLLFETDILMGAGPSSIRNDMKVSSIGIPVDFGYILASKSEKINYLIGFGGLLNIYLDNKTEAILLHEKAAPEDLSSAMNKVNQSLYSLGIFAGMEIQLNNKLILGIEPNIRFTPNKFTLYLYKTEAQTVFEAGLTVRIRKK